MGDCLSIMGCTSSIDAVGGKQSATNKPEKKFKQVQGPSYDPDSQPRKKSKYYYDRERIERSAPKPKRKKRPEPLRLYGNGTPIIDDPKMVNTWWESESAY